jgi:hypothetical protein
MASSEDKDKSNKFKEALNFKQAEQAIPEEFKKLGTFKEVDEATGLTKFSDFIPNEEMSEDYEDILRHFNRDPKKYYVVNGSVKFRQWNAADGSTANHIMVEIAAKDPNVNEEVLKATQNRLKNIKAVPVSKKLKGDNAMVVIFSDWQLGKNERGGTEKLVERINLGVAETIWRIKNLQKFMKFDEIIVASLGDIVEGCDGFYAQQTYSVEYNQAHQLQIAVTLMQNALKEFGKLGLPVTFLAVPGNHGENRKNGKSYTDFMDNADIAMAWHVENSFQFNDKLYKQYKFIYPNHPDDDIVLTYESHGNILGFCHGHQFRSGGGALALGKAQAWHKNQKYGDWEIGYSNILNYGHFHHYSVLEDPQLIIGAPALDGGSKWIEQTHGKRTHAGILSYTIDKQGANNFYIAKKKSMKDFK